MIEQRSAEGKPERLAGLAAELVRLKVDMILAPATASPSAARSHQHHPHRRADAETRGAGLVKSLWRPGGNHGIGLRADYLRQAAGTAQGPGAEDLAWPSLRTPPTSSSSTILGAIARSGPITGDAAACGRGTTNEDSTPCSKTRADRLIVEGMDSPLAAEAHCRFCDRADCRRPPGSVVRRSRRPHEYGPNVLAIFVAPQSTPTGSSRAPSPPISRSSSPRSSSSSSTSRPPRPSASSSRRRSYCGRTR